MLILRLLPIPFLLLALAPPARAQSKSMLQVHLYEARGQLDLARMILQRDSGKLSPDQKKHARLLEQVDSALKRSIRYEKGGSLELAEGEIAPLVALTAGDPGLRAAVAHRRAELDHIRRLRTGSAALDVARTLFSQKNFDLAEAQYSRIFADTGNLYPQAIRNTAAGELRRARQARAQAEGFAAAATAEWIRARHGLGTFVVWLGIVAAAAAALFIFQWAARPRRGAVLDVDDMTAEGDGDRRTEARARLLRDISRSIRVIAHTRGTSIGGNAEDLDGVANLRTGSPLLEQVEKLVADGTLKLGPVAINPRQLITFFSVLQDRPFETTLKGYLTRDGEADAESSATLLFIERFDVVRRKRVKHPGFYQTHGAGAAGRRDAIRDFAIRYIFDHTTERPTEVFESFRDYCRGLDHLESGPGTGGGDPLAAARAFLESAICHDPLNWLARFKLAEVMRKQGEYEGAVLHFEELQETNRRNPALQSPAFRNYLRANPDYPFVVDYHLALTLSLGFDYARQDSAVKKFDDLLSDIARAA